MIARKTGRTLGHLLGWSLALAVSQAHAGATTDGSVGAIQTLAGKFTIPQTLGTINGGNLFHSFRDFSVGTGESATFTTTSALQNIIGRVTGGMLSNINGLLQLSPAAGSRPSFYFINPAGVTFGAGAVVDVPAGFFVSTAHYLKFADGNFHADPARASTLSAAPPEAFGFLGTTRAAITVKEGARLSPQPMQPISLVAGDIEITGAGITTTGGDIRVVAVAQETLDVGFSQSLPDARGNLNILDGGTIEAKTEITIEGGNVQVSAGDIRIDGQGSGKPTGVFSSANSEYANNAGWVEVRATGRLSLSDGGQIESNTSAWGNAGNVIVTAGSIVIDGQERTTGISSNVGEDSSGIGGNVYLNTNGSLSIRNGGVVSASTFSSGSAGTVAVNAGSIDIDGNHGNATGIFSDSGSSSNRNIADIRGHAGGIEVQVAGDLSIANHGLISSSSYSRGNAGEVRITAANVAIADAGGISSKTGEASAGYAGKVFVTTPGALSISNGSSISTSFSGSGGTASDSASGNSGWIYIDAGSVTIDGQGLSTGIFSTANPHSVASAGLVGVSVSGDLTLKNGAEISSSTYSTGESGIVSVVANNILIDGKGRTTGIFSSTQNDDGWYSGNANSVDVTAKGNLSVLNGGQISSSTYFSGNAGKVTLTAQSLNIDAHGTQGSAVPGTGVYTSSSGAGNAGDVKITADRLAVANGGEISSSATGQGIAGDVKILGENATISGAASITTSAVNGNGGSIGINESGVLMIDRSQISTSVSGLTNGDGGNIAITANSLVMNTGFVQANTAATNANGGLVSISAQTLIPSGDTLFVGGSTPYAFAPGLFGLNVIQAAAPTGVSGEVRISTPALDVSTSLVGLNTQMMKGDQLARRPCENLGGSSLASTGRGGLPLTGADYLSPSQLSIQKLPARPATSLPMVRLAAQLTCPATRL